MPIKLPRIQINQSWLVSLIVVPLLLTGCGTFQLASGIYPPVGKSPNQQQTDTLVCKDRAKLEANTAGRQTGAFLLGMTLVGAPVAFELEKTKQREVFSECMTALGYRIVPATDAPNNAKPTQQPVQLASPAREITTQPNTQATEQQTTTPASSASSRDEATQLEKLKDLRNRDLISEEEYNAKRKAILDKL